MLGLGDGKSSKNQTWSERHPTRATIFMKEVGIDHPQQQITCPKCGQVIKQSGEELSGTHVGKYGNHVGSDRCLTQQKYGRMVGTDLQNIRKREIKEVMEEGARPKCECGCGGLVTFNPVTNRWARYMSGHNEFTSSRSIEAKLASIIDGETIVDLRNRLGMTSKDASRLSRQLEERGFLTRKRVLQNGRYTYMLILRAKRQSGATAV